MSIRQAGVGPYSYKRLQNAIVGPNVGAQTTLSDTFPAAPIEASDVLAVSPRTPGIGDLGIAYVRPAIPPGGEFELAWANPTGGALAGTATYSLAAFTRPRSKNQRIGSLAISRFSLPTFAIGNAAANAATTVTTPGEFVRDDDVVIATPQAVLANGVHYSHALGEGTPSTQGLLHWVLTNPTAAPIAVAAIPWEFAVVRSEGATAPGSLVQDGKVRNNGPLDYRMFTGATGGIGPVNPGTSLPQVIPVPGMVPGVALAWSPETFFPSTLAMYCVPGVDAVTLNVTNFATVGAQSIPAMNINFVAFL